MNFQWKWASCLTWNLLDCVKLNCVKYRFDLCSLKIYVCWQLVIFACFEASGPLVDLYFFSLGTLKHCTLHIVNLGILHISNGSAMCLGWRFNIFQPFDLIWDSYQLLIKSRFFPVNFKFAFLWLNQGQCCYIWAFSHHQFHLQMFLTTIVSRAMQLLKTLLHGGVCIGFLHPKRGSTTSTSSKRNMGVILTPRGTMLAW